MVSTPSACPVVHLPSVSFNSSPPQPPPFCSPFAVVQPPPPPVRGLTETLLQDFEERRAQLKLEESSVSWQYFRALIFEILYINVMFDLIQVSNLSSLWVLSGLWSKVLLSLKLNDHVTTCFYQQVSQTPDKSVCCFSVCWNPASGWCEQPGTFTFTSQHELDFLCLHPITIITFRSFNEQGWWWWCQSNVWKSF